MVERKKTNLRKARAAVRIFYTWHQFPTLTVCIENLGQAVEYTTTSLLLSYLPNINERSSRFKVQFVGVVECFYALVRFNVGDKHAEAGRKV